MVGGHEKPVEGVRKKSLMAITDTACTKTVAGHEWYEKYCEVADHYGMNIEIIEEEDKFRFGSHYEFWGGVGPPDFLLGSGLFFSQSIRNSQHRVASRFGFLRKYQL